MAHAAAHLQKARELEQLSELRALAKAREKRQRHRERAERKRQVTPTHTYTAAGGGCSDQVSVLHTWTQCSITNCYTLYLSDIIQLSTFNDPLLHCLNSEYTPAAGVLVTVAVWRHCI